jgi:hypothetical protein
MKIDNMKILSVILLICSSSCSLLASANAENILPPRNPYLADSYYAMLHGSTAATPISTVDGPIDVSRRLTDAEIIWKPLGFGNAWDINYSGPYPDGRRAIWVGGADRMVKLDIDTLETLATYAFEGKFYSESEVRAFIEKADAMIPAAKTDKDALKTLLDYLAETVAPVLRSTGAGSLYRFISNENDQYVMTLNPESGGVFLSVYGDKIPGDIESDIVKKRQWIMPRKEGVFSIGVAMGITYDGVVILGTSDGRLFAVSRDLKNHQELQLPGLDDKYQGQYMGAFLRNGIAIDDTGGIFVVTRRYMHRVQWTGEKLSLNEADGAWTVEYAQGANGSGTTPTLMGFGEGSDKFVVIADGKDDVSVNLYWRHHIPGNWVGLEGHPRRLAGTHALTFGPKGPTKFTVEGSPLTVGYGVFFPNDTSDTPPPQQGARDYEALAKYHSVVSDDYTIRGGVRYDWNPASRKLELTWTTDLELCPTICTYSTNGLLYCFGRRDNEYSMEAIDWQSGKPKFHYLLGESYRFNSNAAVTRIAPNGDIDCPCSMGSGIVRLSPRP